MYVKLFSSILDSSVWTEPMEVRVLWVSMLAMADRDGFVRASPSGLARRANIDLTLCRKALKVLESPDVESSNQEWAGRRVEAIEGGWQVLNYATYRDLADSDIRREQVRAAVRRHRAKESSVITGNHVKAHTDTEVAVEVTECVTPSVSHTRRASRQPKTGLDDPAFCEAVASYPRRTGGDPRHLAWRSWHASLARGEDALAMLAGVGRYKRYCEAAGKVGTERVMQMRRFFGPAREWDQSWEPPPREQRDARYAPPLPVTPREPSVGPQQFGDVMRRAMGEAVAGPRYVCAREPHMLLRGVTYPCGAEVPADLVTESLLRAGYVARAKEAP